MKRFLLCTITICVALALFGASNEMSRIGTLDIGFTGLPEEGLYPTYLADPLATNTTIAYRNYLIDEVHPDADGEVLHWDLALGTRFSFLRLSPIENPDLGLELELGMTLTSFLTAEHADFLGVDGIYYYGFAYRPVDWASFRFARHHICSHNGDQIDVEYDGSEYVDYDLNPALNDGTFVRDDFILAAAMEPLFFLKEKHPVLAKSARIYGDFSLYIPGGDPIIIDNRLNIPSKYAYIYYQCGMEFEVPLFDQDLGSFYVAGQISRWQETAFAPNYSFRAGYIVAEGKNGFTMRFSATYYDGQALLNNYRYMRTKYIGAEFSIDT